MSRFSSVRAANREVLPYTEHVSSIGRSFGVTSIDAPHAGQSTVAGDDGGGRTRVFLKTDGAIAGNCRSIISCEKRGLTYDAANESSSSVDRCRATMRVNAPEAPWERS